MPDNFWLKGLAKFRQMAILAIFGGYFWRGHSNEACDTIFYTEFDAVLLLFTHFGYIPPIGDFAIFGGYFWRYSNEDCDTRLLSIDYFIWPCTLRVKSEDYYSFYTPTFLLKNRVV